MRIALVVPGGVDPGAEYRVIPALLALIRRLSRHHEVHVFALRQQPDPESWELCGAHVDNIGHRNTRLRAVRAICARHRAARFQVIQSIWSGPCGLIAVCASRILRIPSLIHVAGGEPVSLADIGYGGRLTWRGRVQEAVALGGASVLTAASCGLVQTLSTLGYAARRLPLGADLDVWRPREPVRRDPGQPARLVHVASLNRVKDQRTLLLALARLAASGAAFEMDVIGEDTLHGEMQSLCEALGLGARVRFHGFLPQSQVVPLVQRAHAMVVSSRHEAGPLAVLEAAAVGVPSVGSAVGHIAEWMPEAALAVPPADAEALAAAIGRLITDEELRLRLAAQAALRSVREDADFTARAFETLHGEVLEHSRGRDDGP